MPDESKSPPVQLEDKIVTTQHTLSMRGKKLEYTAKAGTVVLRGESEKDGAFAGIVPEAQLFFVAYTLSSKDPSTRPITFCFNGGPGSSSVWLHMGAFGPRKVVMGDTGALHAPPFGLEDNPFHLLEHSDLVFIDPVGTGFSRVAEGGKAKDFWGFTKDIESVGDFIRLYVSRENRWLSPKFLAGESYGTTRASGLAGYLQERHGMYLNGIVLVSTVLDFSTIRFDVGNDLPHVLYLPAFAATAYYHGKVRGASLETHLRQAEELAGGAYLQALFKGNRLESNDQNRLVREMARLTGVSRDFIERSNLRLEIMRFCKELRRDSRLTVGRLDSRFTSHDRDAAGQNFEFDPSYAAIYGAYTAAFNQYVRTELGFETDNVYEILSWKVWQPWSYKEFENRYVNVAETLRKAMNMNPHLRVLVMNGYYDLATPYWASDYVFDHLAIPAHLQTNLETKYYEAGHMMYVHSDSHKAMAEDLKGFVGRSVITPRRK
jgi:carboxypeptidase C (cathepsin A)